MTRPWYVALPTRIPPGEVILDIEIGTGLISAMFYKAVLKMGDGCLGYYA